MYHIEVLLKSKREGVPFIRCFEYGGFSSANILKRASKEESIAKAEEIFAVAEGVLRVEVFQDGVTLPIAAFQ